MALNERTAIVTGGSRGIGRAISMQLAARGFNVVVAFAADAKSANRTVEDILVSGRQAIAVRADVADESAVAALFKEAERTLGRIDVVVNAAGIMRSVRSRRWTCPTSTECCGRTSAARW
jgi:3-oxoacyl-[acyl-carrier protein] reductase